MALSGRVPVIASTEDGKSLFLLVSLLLFFVLSPFLERDRIGELILVFSMYVLLVAAMVELSGRVRLKWLLTGTGIISMVIVVAVLVHPERWVLMSYFSSLTLFFGIVSVGLFTYLGRTGPITSGRIYASVSLYFVLAMFYFAAYNVINTIHPGAFQEVGPTGGMITVPRSSLMYFSIVTLTTLGYGDIVPVYAPARMISGLEAATGVLYIAITVARLVAAYQRTEHDFI